MKRVLVVDDDTSFLASLVDAFVGEDYEVLTASDGLQALEILDRLAVDLVLTDIKMPRLDGIQLVRELMNRDGFVPCVVMTAFGTAALETNVAQLGGLDFVHKPIDLAGLKQRIREHLATRQETSIVHGIALASFVQLLSLERKTCTLKAKSDAGTGLIFLRNGELLDATVGDRRGLEAAYELLSWPRAEIAMSAGCRRTTRIIDEDINSVLLEGLRRLDEARGLPLAGDVRTDGKQDKETVMALEAHLEEFKGIKGYIAAGILEFTGEMLASHTTNSRVDLAATGAVFNDIFRAAHEASGKIGLDVCRNMAIGTPKGVVVMECSGADKTPHVHMIAILEEGGNQALAKMTIAKVLPKVVSELS
jgi:DNA-binding response OmpR family regulator/predicted regulator of Ras-like GTPase activity (Roadblock/LC7/MglB family)